MMSHGHEVSLLTRLQAQDALIARYEAELATLRSRSLLAEALAESAASLNSTLDVEVVMQRILEQVGRVVPHDTSNIMLIEDGNAFMRYRRGYAPERDAFFASLAFPLENFATLQQMLQTGQPLVIPDTRHQTFWKSHEASPEVLSYAAAPIISEGQTLGFLNLDSATPNTFTDSDGTRLKAFADQAAIAIRNARLYAEALQASHIKSQFLATMSHELRTPLNAILNYTDLLLVGSYGPLEAMQQERLGRVFHNAQRLVALINDLLDLHKIESGYWALNLQAVSTLALLQHMQTHFAPLAARKGLAWRMEAPQTDFYLWADEKRIFQVLNHLLNNALKFTPHGQVSLTGRLEGEQACLSVQDSGIGITEAQIEHIFDMFNQADNSSTRQYEGTGLGLALCKRIVEKHGGSLRVTSKPGQGSTFEVYLPIAAVEKSA
jgi:signal transduction histidine kinase